MEGSIASHKNGLTSWNCEEGRSGGDFTADFMMLPLTVTPFSPEQYLDAIGNCGLRVAAWKDSLRPRFGLFLQYKKCQVPCLQHVGVEIILSVLLVGVGFYAVY